VAARRRPYLFYTPKPPGPGRTVMAEQMIDYKGVLADLRARRAALDQAIAAIEAIAGESGSVLIPPLNGTGVGREIEPGTFFNLNTLDATRKFLGLAGKTQTTQQIGDALRKGSLNVKDASVAAILQRAVRDDDPDLVSVGRNMWGLKRFYGK
jgi:hypothetical protein